MLAAAAGGILGQAGPVAGVRRPRTGRDTGATCLTPTEVADGW